VLNESQVDLGFLGNLSEQAVFRVLDSAPDALVLVDAQGVIRLVNAQTENLFGYARQELLGSPIELLIPERFRGGHVARRMSFSVAPTLRAMGSGLELYGLRKDGREFPVEISLSPLHTEQGLYVSSSIRDISARKQLEAGAKLAAQRLLSAVESIQGMFALFDAEDRLVLCNSEFRQFFAPAVTGAIVGRTFAEILNGSLAEHVFSLGEGGEAELRGQWLAYHKTPVGTFDFRTREGHTMRVAERQTAEHGIVTTIWDISDDVRREDELKQARALAEAANAAKTEFLSSMSHELRTPLNAVLGFAQLMKRDKKTPPNASQLEMLQHILRGGEHLLKLIDDVLDLARIEAGRVTISLEPVTIASVIEEVQTTLNPMAERAAMQLQVGPVPADAQTVLADRTRFAQVLMNYGSNAIKYGSRGGLVEFQFSRPAESVLRVSVVDRGQGIPLDKQDKIFQPFQRAGQELGTIEGTGIGLAICKRLAELMGGAVGFQSSPGQGCSFWIDLVLQTAHQGSEERPSIVPEREWSLASGGVRHVVVYVEDNPSNIAFMTRLMEEFEAVQLITAPTAEIGIEVARSRKPDAIIMDINLPGMNGIEAAHKLREFEETRSIPVIALSAAALMSERQRNDATIFYRYLTKPIKVDELIGTLEKVLKAP
jgi:PAS domain S-box-containing protein